MQRERFARMQEDLFVLVDGCKSLFTTLTDASVNGGDFATASTIFGMDIYSPSVGSIDAVQDGGFVAWSQAGLALIFDKFDVDGDALLSGPEVARCVAVAMMLNGPLTLRCAAITLRARCNFSHLFTRPHTHLHLHVHVHLYLTPPHPASTHVTPPA